MLRFLFGLSLLTAVVPSAFAHGVRRFDNGRWFDGQRFVERTAWSVEGKLRFDYKGSADETVDLAERYVVPPFADAHNHDFGSGNGLSEKIAQYLAAGVFYVKNPNNMRSAVDPIRSRMNAAESVDVVWSNGGLTSAGGHPVQIYASVSSHLGRSPESMENDAWFAINSKKDLEEKWPKVLEGHPDFIKCYLERSEEHEKRRDSNEFAGKRGLDPELLPEIVARAHASKLRVSVHVTSAADFRAALRSGADEITHLPLERILDEDARLAATQGVTVVTTTTSHKPLEGIKDIDAVYRENLKRLRAAGARIAIGTDNGTLVLEEIDNVRRLGVFDDATLLRLWTMETPKTIFPARRVGCLDDGCEASFLALDGNPIEDWSSVRRVAIRVKNGHPLKVTAPAPGKPGIANAIAQVVMHNGVEAAVAEYKRLRSEKFDEFDFGEPQLNALGYALMRHDKLAEAIAFFRLNAELFPRSANAWDSLGEALLARGDREEARRSYRKSLELNPDNAKAKETLSKLDGSGSNRQ